MKWFIFIMSIPLLAFDVSSGYSMQTGQTQCFETTAPYSSTNCSNTVGQDGNYQKGRQRVYGRESSNEVYETSLGYTWEDPHSHTLMNWTEAKDYCDNHFGSIGHIYHLPFLEELKTLVDYNRSNPAIDSIFTSTSNQYWSHTEFNTTTAWTIDFKNGATLVEDKTAIFPVRCMSRWYAVVFLPRYKRNDLQDTVYDAYSDVTWVDVSGVESHVGIPIDSWSHAVSHCENLHFSGRSDWRLPTINELLNIVDYSKHHMVLDSVFQCYVTPMGYLSSTTYVSDPSKAWGVEFYSGNSSGYSKNQSTNYARCVRDGEIKNILTPIYYLLD